MVKTSRYATARVGFVCMFLVFVFSLLSCVVLWLVTSNSDNQTQAVQQIGITVGVFSALISVGCIGFSAWSITFGRKIGTCVTILAFIILQSAMLGAFTADMAEGWYKSDEKSQKDGSLALTWLLSLGTVAMFGLLLFGTHALVDEASNSNGASDESESSPARSNKLPPGSFVISPSFV